MFAFTKDDILLSKDKGKFVMDIYINGKAADIALETEKTVGEVLSGMEGWLRGSGFRLGGLEIDGEPVTGTDIASAFDREFGGISSVNIKVYPRSELAVEALCEARGLLSALAEGEDRESIARLWKASAAASFLEEESDRFFRDINTVFDPNPVEQTDSTEAGVKAGRIITLVDEHIRELLDPEEELRRIESLVAGIADRLEELPLDIQTGKDGRAAETVNVFTAVAEKLFRLFSIVRERGQTPAGSASMGGFLGEFNAALKELLEAYEGRDVVLVGDLAEYELAPRLRSFYDALKVPA
jgi:hypothetical protein